MRCHRNNIRNFWVTFLRTVDAAEADMFMVFFVPTFDGVAVENAVNVAGDFAGVSPSIFMDSGSFLSKNFR